MDFICDETLSRCVGMGAKIIAAKARSKEDNAYRAMLFQPKNRAVGIQELLEDLFDQMPDYEGSAAGVLLVIQCVLNKQIFTGAETWCLLSGQQEEIDSGHAIDVNSAGIMDGIECLIAGYVKTRLALPC